MNIRFVFGILPAFIRYGDDMKDWVGGEAKRCFITIRPKYLALKDEGIHQHELEHVKQWYLLMLSFVLLSIAALAMPFGDVLDRMLLAVMLICIGVVAHEFLYNSVRAYRLRCEVDAYHLQLATYQDGSDAMWAARALSEKYDLNITVSEAMELLCVGADGQYGSV
ncbi:hypothetical protein [Azonexus sp. IMCC34839]|uniref:hypothetical protein n=1 Tax=Azonexus sp. IMCC34839 TaxID=3133695 RepID=UPI00399AE8F9